MREKEILGRNRQKERSNRKSERERQRKRETDKGREKGRRHISTKIYKRYHLRNKDISIRQFNLNFLLLQSLYFCKIIRFAIPYLAHMYFQTFAMLY